jgi:ribose 5-phosphate isomerase B
VRLSVCADELAGIARGLVAELERRGHVVSAHGALNEGERDDWAWGSQAVAREVADGRAQQGVVCCWTGTGASIAANKVAGVRAALCCDGASAAGARRWNDANVLALSLRSTSEAELCEILDAWFAGEPSGESDDRANVEHLAQIESASIASAAGARAARPGVWPQLSVSGGVAAVDFYTRVFGAVEVYRVGGTLANAAVVSQLVLGESAFWVADESPEHENFSPASLRGSTTRMLLVVDDPDATIARAVAAGAREVRAACDEHGWRLGRIEDPFGHHWEIGRPLGPWPPACGVHR